MFLTVTANSALDRVIFVDRFQPGTVMRPGRVVDAVGGKGLDVSVALRAFGLDTLALGFVAGETGKTLTRLLESYGIRHELVWVRGETRIAHVIVETDYRRHSHLIASGYTVDENAEAGFLDRYCQNLGKARFVLMGGSIPPGLSPDFYLRLARMARAANVPVLVDGSGEPLRRAVSAQPDIIKMNEAEFAHTFSLPGGSLKPLQLSAWRVRREQGIRNLVITRGEQGILAYTSEGDFLAGCPKQEAVNAAGAGDAVSAALAWRLSLGESWPAALRWAAAAGAAAVLTEATAECRREDVERLLPLAFVQSLSTHAD